MHPTVRTLDADDARKERKDEPGWFHRFSALLQRLRCSSSSVRHVALRSPQSWIPRKQREAARAKAEMELVRASDARPWRRS